MSARRRAVLAGLAGLPALAQGQAKAQEAAFPARPVRIVVPYPAGGSVDLVARITAEALAAQWRQNVVVEVRSGGNGEIAAAAVRDAPADGYTILLGGPFLVANRHLQVGRGGDPFTTWRFAARLVDSPSLLVVPKASTARSLAELVQQLAASPLPQPYGYGGQGTTQHMVGEIWRNLAGLRLEAVPYRGGPPMVPDLLQGSLAVAVLPLVVAAPHVETGDLRALAIAGEKRSPIFPAVPTLTELGYAPAEVTSWLGLVVRAQTPEPVLQAISAAALAALAQPALVPRFAPLGATVAAQGPEEFTAFAQREDARLRDAIRRYGIRAE